jgi:hypothetical protein
MKSDQEEMTARLEAKIEANYEKFMATMQASHGRMMSCLEKTEVHLEYKVQTSEEMESGA